MLSNTIQQQLLCIAHRRFQVFHGTEIELLEEHAYFVSSEEFKPQCSSDRFCSYLGYEGAFSCCRGRREATLFRTNPNAAVSTVFSLGNRSRFSRNLDDKVSLKRTIVPKFVISKLEQHFKKKSSQ